MASLRIVAVNFCYNANAGGYFMRTWLILFIVMLGVATFAHASDSGTLNLFYGFSLTNAGLSGHRATYYGGGANLAVTVHEHTSIVGDFSIQLRHKSNLYYALAGVRQEFPYRAANVFVEGLAGISSLNPNLGDSQTSGAFGGGGGVDWVIGSAYGIRAPQVDILFGSHKGANFHDVRVQAGGYFRF